MAVIRGLRVPSPPVPMAVERGREDREGYQPDPDLTLGEIHDKLKMAQEGEGQGASALFPGFGGVSPTPGWHSQDFSGSRGRVTMLGGLSG